MFNCYTRPLFSGVGYRQHYIHGLFANLMSTFKAYILYTTQHGLRTVAVTEYDERITASLLQPSVVSGKLPFVA